MRQRGKIDLRFFGAMITMTSLLCNLCICLSSLKSNYITAQLIQFDKNELIDKNGLEQVIKQGSVNVAAMLVGAKSYDCKEIIPFHTTDRLIQLSR